MKTFTGVLFGVLVVVVLGWFFLANDVAQDRVFAPKREETRRVTFEQSKAFNDGVSQDINKFRGDYALADSTGKKMIAQVIRHRLAGYDTNKLSPDLQSFVNSLPQ